jgi:RNA polymerase sigma factor (sigma-70 family)
MGARDREWALVDRCRAGEARAWEELLPYYREHLVHFARGRVGQLDSEDMAQEALLDAWRRIQEYDPVRVRLGSWLKLLAWGRCSNHRRTADALRRSSPCEIEEWMEPALDAVSPHVDARDVLRRLPAMIEQLSCRERQAIEGVMRDEEQHVTASRCRTISRTISSALASARRKLRGMTLSHK